MTSPKGIVFFGADGGCLDAIYLADELYNCPKYILSDSHVPPPIAQMEHIGGFDAIYSGKLLGLHFVYQCGNVSNHNNRHIWFERAISEGLVPLSCVSSHAYVHKSAVIGKGSIIYPGTCIMPNVKLGKNTVVLPNSTVNHDCEIGDYCIINSGVTLNGSVQLERNVFVGASTTIREKTKIASETTIGMGSLVLNSIEEKGIYFGRPTRKK